MSVRSRVTVLTGLVVWCLLLIAGCVTETTGSLGRKASQTDAADAYVDLALAYFRNREYDLAMNRLEKALQINPEHLEANAVLGLVYQEQGEVVPAEEQFRRVLRIDPSFTRGRTYLAAFLYRQGRLQESLRESRVAAEDLKYDGRAQVFANIGLIETQLGNNGAAIEAYEKSIVLQRSAAPVYLALADLYLAQGQIDNANRRYTAFREYVRQGKANHTAASLATGIRIARAEGDRDREASLLLLMKNTFPASAEYRNLAGGG